ncbi:MAG TPA: RNA 2',3'-cyclic phosphodiesterase [Allosphingosinicella sp.]|jgi:2'-5' RNA ligase
MHRLFVAIRPPAAIRDQLLDLMEAIAGARWQDEDQLHLTVQFIGEVDRHLARDVDAALSAIRHPAFELSLNGLGSFDRRGQAKTLWAGVSPHGPLKALHKKVDQALVRTGLEPERRTYAPHITLARLARGGGPIGPLLQRWGGVTSEPFAVEEFRLYESRLTSNGAIHSLIERYTLD